jgi:hypothetical protein
VLFELYPTPCWDVMPHYGNFYNNVCLVLGTLKRGVVHKSPAVTVRLSKVRHLQANVAAAAADRL